MNLNEDIIKQFIQETGCDIKIANMLLKFTGGDYDGAKRIIKAVPKDIFAFKAKFATQILGYYGAIFFCYDEKENKIKRLISAVSNEKEIGKIDISSNWRDFEKEVYSYVSDKVIDGLKIEQLNKSVIEKEFIKKTAKILGIGKTVDEELLNNLLVNELYNVFPDTNIAVKLNVDKTDVFELNIGQEDSEPEAEVEKTADTERIRNGTESKLDGVRIEKSLIVLKVEPVLSPVHGVEIKELEFGDEIQVRITDERDIADYLSELLGAKVDNIRVPVFTKIVEVKELEGGNAAVLTQFGPGIMGMFKVLTDARVASGIETEPERKESALKGLREINPLFVAGGIVMVFILFLFLIFLSR